MRAWTNLLATLALSTLALFALDAALFRTHLYQPYIEPQSYAGQAALAAEPAADTTIYVLGDSRIAEGLSAPTATASSPSSHARFFNASVPGSTLRVWHYLLREADPTAARFQAIVLPFDDYDDEDGPWDWADRTLDLQIATFLLQINDLPTLIPSFAHPAPALEAARALLFRGFLLKDDLQQFLLHPTQRLEAARQWNAHGREWLDAYPGNPGSLAETQPNPRQARPLEPQHGHYAAYRRFWLGKILDRYRRSPTRLVAIRVPRAPYPQNHPPGLLPSAVHEFPALTVLHPDTFADLERPEFFFDDLHLNAKGRSAFSQRLAEALR